MDLEEIFKAHEQAVYVYLLRVTGDPSLAEDLAQDALLRAWEAIGAFRGDSSFRTWLLAIARARLADHFRRRRLEVLQEPPDEAIPQDPTRRWEIAEALDALPVAFREAIVLCDVFGLEPREAALVTGLTDNAFRVRLHRARRAFREVYGSDG